MPARLILNADDFGLTSGINRAIAELHHAGALTSATLMATGPAFDDAVRTADALTTLGVGCHIVLTDGVPAAPPSSIPTLLGPDRKRLWPTLTGFLRALLLGQIRESDIEREALAQVQKVQRAGIRITHLDTHKHTHLFPQVTRPLLRIAETNHISAIRNPFEPPWSLNLHSPTASKASRLRRLQVKLLGSLRRRFDDHRQLRTGAIRTTDGTLGVSATGDLNTPTLHQLLDAMPDGIWELVCHPGYNDCDLDRIPTRLRAHREIELRALLAEIPQRFMLPNPPQLIHYGDLAQPAANPQPEMRA